MTEPAPPQTEEALEEEFAGLDVDAPRVGIIAGSQSDLRTMERAAAVLAEHDVRHELRVISAHHDPDVLAEYCRNARMRGLRAIIAGAARSAALPGIAASHTDLPVIGVPLSGERSVAGGLDAILGVVQVPTGVPVAAVGLDDARNAAHLALRMLDC